MRMKTVKCAENDEIVPVLVAEVSSAIATWQDTLDQRMEDDLSLSGHGGLFAVGLSTLLPGSEIYVLHDPTVGGVDEAAKQERAFYVVRWEGAFYDNAGLISMCPRKVCMSYAKEEELSEIELGLCAHETVERSAFVSHGEEEEPYTELMDFLVGTLGQVLWSTAPSAFERILIPWGALGFPRELEN